MLFENFIASQGAICASASQTRIAPGTSVQTSSSPAWLALAWRAPPPPRAWRQTIHARRPTVSTKNAPTTHWISRKSSSTFTPSVATFGGIAQPCCGATAKLQTTSSAKSAKSVATSARIAGLLGAFGERAHEVHERPEVAALEHELPVRALRLADAGHRRAVDAGIDAPVDVDRPRAAAEDAA